MNRDLGPRFNLGPNTDSRDNLLMGSTGKVQADPESGIIAKKLHDHPLMKFMAVTVASLAAAHVAGKVVQRAGMEVGYKFLGEGAENVMPKASRTYKEVQGILDEMEGLNRVLREDNPDGFLFVRDKKTGAITHGSETNQAAGFLFTKEEVAFKRDLGIDVGDSPAVWGAKKEIQQRLVRQARRLPYELPAMYAAQHLAIDPITGNDSGKRKVKWTNPLDTFTDFVSESAKNVAFAIMPFESAVGGASAFKRTALTYGDDMVYMAANQKMKHDASVSLRMILGRVGADSADIMNKGVRGTTKMSQAFGAGVKAAREESENFKSFANNVAEASRRGGSPADKAKEAWNQAFMYPGGGFNAASLDQLPGPFHGIHSGFAAAKGRYNELGAAYKAFDKSMSFGMSHLSAAEQVAMGNVPGVRTQLGDFASSVHQVARDGTGTRSFRQGDFYQEVLQTEYQKQVKSRLINSGVSEDAAEKFYSLSHIKLPTPGNKAFESHISKRIALGEKAFYSSEGDFAGNLYKRLGMVSENDAELIAKELPDIMGSADRLFQDKGFIKRLDKRAESLWSFAESRQLPQLGGSILGRSKPSYASFDGDISHAQFDFLRRKTAQRLGVELVDDHGTRATNSAINNQLLRRGFDPEDKYKMRAFLGTHKEIGMPWESGGKNIFGFKPLLASEAVDKGFFRTGEKNEQQVRSLLDTVKRHDPLSRSIGDYTMPGTFVSQNGAILDFNAFRRSISGGFDTLANEFQIPIVGIKPFETMASKYLQAKKERNVFEFLSARTPHPFLGKERQVGDIGYLFANSGKAGYRGSVYGMGVGEGGTLVTRKLAGTYEASATSTGMGGKHARLGAGETGKIPWRKPPGEKDGFLDNFRRRLSQNPQQERSIGNFAKRLKNRKTDINNPYVMTELLSKGELKAGRNVFHLDGSMNLVNKATGEIHTEADKVAESFVENLNNRYLRNFTFQNSVVKELEANPKTKHLFEVDFSGQKPRSLPAGKVKLSEIKTPEQIDEFLRLYGEQGLSVAKTLGPEDAAMSRRADEAYLWKYLGEKKGATTEIVPQANRSSTIHTRLDLIKSDMYRSVMLRKSITSGEDFTAVLPEIMNDLSKMRGTGALSSAQYAEATTALLSLQVNFLSFKNFNRGSSRTQDVREVINALTKQTGKPGKAMQEMLEEAASGKAGIQQTGLMSKLTPSFRRGMSVSEYSYDGMEYNPFGHTQTTVVPTIGTVMQRNPRKAMTNMLGLTTWSDPEHYSPGSIPMSHMFERLNRFGSGLNIGLSTAGEFKGPLDFYARGIVGKRILPITAGAAGLMAVDRTAGGLVYGKDEYGNRQYKPLVTGAIATGAVHAQAAVSGIVPTGPGYSEKINELTQGDVAIRSGRYFPLGNTPWKGGKIKYYGPSWYRKFMSGHMYTDDAHGSPLERLAFGYDFSPLKPFDPYHYENKHSIDRPYPLTGEYFTGPWGPLGSALNMTVGRVLKPQKEMHKDEVNAGLAAYRPFGESGAVFSPVVTLAGDGAGFSPGGGGGASNSGYAGVGAGVGGIATINSSLSKAGGQKSNSNFGSGAAMSALSNQNANLAQAGSQPSRSNFGSGAAFAAISAQNAALSGNAKMSALPMSPSIVAATAVVHQGSNSYQARKMGYEAQELFGIYGFAFGAVREKLGLGSQDFSNQGPVLQSAAKMTSSTKSFWEMNIGGLGDAPLSIEGDIGNIEFSEIVRRFVPKERPDVDYVNPILNTMNEKAPWLPGSNYFTDFKTGDPYTKVEAGEMRLPGKGYMRLHDISPDGTGLYGKIDRLSILADVAPYSDEYKAMLSDVQSNASPLEMLRVQEIMKQVSEKSKKHNFTPYKYKHATASELGITEVSHAAGLAWEKISHLNTVLNTKFQPHTTAVEDWERNNVYGATFPQWKNPVDDYLKPIAYNATQRNPATAALVTGGIGSLFATSSQGKALSAVVGGLIGFGASSISHINEKISGHRYMPLQRKKEVALEENIDILTYVKNKRLAEQASQMGDSEMAAEFLRASSQTMYGAQVDSGDVNALAQSLPMRKREHFKAMVFAPKDERKQILSTAGRLERRFYEAAWGYQVEEKPDLAEYFQSHELPEENSSFWAADTSMEYVKIKMGQSMGLDMSQMGYYPQQIKEANLSNPEYPSYSTNQSHRNVEQQLQRILSDNRINARIVQTRNLSGGNKVNIRNGTY